MTDVMLEIKQIADTLASKVPDIDLILLYGSFARGLGHELSDYDIIIVCDSKKVVWEFLLKDRVVQAWSTTWQDIEQIIAGEKGYWVLASATLQNAKIIWEKNTNYSKKFENLIAKIDKPNKKLVSQAFNFDQAFHKLWLLNDIIDKSKPENYRLILWDIAITISHKLALLNGKNINNNWGKQTEELDAFDIKPEDFKSRYEQMIKVEPIKAIKIAEELILEIQQLYKKHLLKDFEEPVAPFENLVSKWASFIEGGNAIKSAAKKKDLVATLYAITNFIEMVFWCYFALQNEIWERNSFYPIDEYLDRISTELKRPIETLLLSYDFEDIANAVDEVIDELKLMFLDKNAELPIAETIEEGLKYLKF